LEDPEPAFLPTDFAIRIANGSLISHLWQAPKLPAAVHRIRAVWVALEESGAVALEAETNVHWQSSSQETDKVLFFL
jgi:hypothetical protein